MSGLGTVPPQELKNAFEAFNRSSEQLTGFYRALEARVAHLNRELATARSQRLEQLAETERLADRLQRLLDTLPAGVIVLDAGGRVIQTNPAAEALLGQSLTDRAWRDVIAGAFVPGTGSGDALTLRDGRLVTLSTCPLGSEPGQILLLQDVTEARRLQERLDRHKRLSAMGEMAARLAHQIRTPLAAALLYVSQLTRPGADVAVVAHKLLDRLRHLETQVRDMLTFARGGRAGDEPVEVAGLLQAVARNLEPLLGADCRLEVTDRSEAATVRANRDALIGAVQNLVTNALYAGGDEAHLELDARPVQGGVEIALHDNGPGVPPAARDRIFEPFFTTRDQGTGLGLAVVQAVARAHDGFAWYRPRVEGGSTFGITLPVEEVRGASYEGRGRGRG